MDELVLLYEKAETLKSEGRLEEAAATYQEAIDKANASTDPDAASRAKLFAGKLGPIYIKLRRYELAKPCYEAVGQELPPSAREHLKLDAGLPDLFLKASKDENVMQAISTCEEIISKTSPHSEPELYARSRILKGKLLLKSGLTNCEESAADQLSMGLQTASYTNISTSDPDLVEAQNLLEKLRPQPPKKKRKKHKLAMHVSKLLHVLHKITADLNQPATPADLARLQETLGPLPADVIAWYTDHDGSSDLPGVTEDLSLAVRLLPIAEALDIQSSFDQELQNIPSLGSIVWLWSDCAGNYIGIYDTGPCTGWLVKYDHEETRLTPAYRSATSLLYKMLEHAPTADFAEDDDDDRSCDIISLPPDVPTIVDDPAHTENDLALSQKFFKLYQLEPSSELGKLYARCSIILTPVQETDTLKSFPEGTFIAKRAAELLRLRGSSGTVHRI